MSYRCLRTDYDIGSVYSYGSTSNEPLVSITKLDLEKILHIRNFWQRHLTNPDEATFSAHLRTSQRARGLNPGNVLGSKNGAEDSMAWILL